MPRHVARLLTLVTVLSLLFMGIVPALAQDGGQPPNLLLELDESGNWVLTVEGVEETLRSQDVDVLSSALGLGLPPLSLGPATVSRASSNNIGYASLLKDDEDFTLFLNGSPVAAVGLREGVVSALSDQMTPEMQQAVASVLASEFGLSARFPGAQGDAPPLDRRVTAVAASEQLVNVIDLGLTMSPDGELVSVGGIDAQTLGFSGRLIDLSPYQNLLDQLSISTAGLDLVANTLGLSVNGNDWLSLALDLEWLQQNVGLLTDLAGVQLGDQVAQYVAIGTDWLDDTEVHVDAYLGTQSQEPPARLALDRPVVVAIQDNSVIVEGVNTGYALDAQTAGYLSRMGSLAFVWDGDRREIRSVVAQEPMPVVALDEGFVAAVGQTFVGEGTAPWPLVDAMLGNARLTGEAVYEDSPRSPTESLAYEVATRTPPLGMTVDVSVSRTNGGVSVWGISLPLGAFDPAMPETVRTYATQYSSISDAVVDLGPAGATVDLAGSRAHVRWDPQTRANALGLAFDTFGPDLGLPAALTSDPARSALEAVVSFVNAFGVTVDVTVVDQDIEEGALDRLIGLFQ